MTPLTKKQKEILQRINSGEILMWSPYAPGIHLPSYAYWKKDEMIIQGRENPIRTIRSLIDKKCVELERIKKHGNLIVKLTNAGKQAIGAQS